MTAKIEELIHKLESFDYRKILPESTSPSYKSSSSAHHRTDSQKNSIDSQRSSQKLNQSQRSQQEIFQIQRAQLALQKKKEKIELQKRCDKIDEGIKNHTKELQQIKKNLRVLEQKAENAERIAKEKQSEQLEAFRIALKPLEDTTNAILEEKSALIRQKEAICKEISEEVSQKEEKTHEFQSLSEEKKNLANEKNKLESELQEIKESEHFIYKEFIQESETKKTLQLIKEKKSKITATIKSINLQISELDDKMKHSSPEQPKNSSDDLSSHSIQKEILDTESYLDLLCTDLSITPLMSFLNEQISNQATPLEYLITKHQLLIIEEKEIELKAQWSNSNDYFKSKIKELSDTIEQQELEMMTLTMNSSPDYELEMSCDENKSNLMQLKREAEKNHRKNAARQKIIAQWKEKNRKTLLLSETEKFINDSFVLNSFKNHIRKNLPKPEQCKTVDKVLDKYLDKVKEKAQAIIELQFQNKHRLRQDTRRAKDLQELHAQKTLLLNEKEILEKDLLRTIALEKMTLKKFEHFKIELDLEKRKKIERITQENMSLTKATLAQIQKTYGQKALNKFKEKEIEELKFSEGIRRDFVKKKIEKIFVDLAELENKAISLENKMNEGCKVVVENKSKSVGKMKEFLEEIERKIKVLDEAEEEMNEKIKGMMDEKQRDIYRSFHRTLRIYGNEENLKGIKRLEGMKEVKEEEIRKMGQEKARLELEFLEKVKGIEIEEIKLKVRLSSGKEE